MPSEISPAGNEQLVFKYIPDLSAIFIAITLWLGVSDLLEMYFTEWVYLRNDFPNLWRLGILVIILFVLVLIITRLRFRSNFTKGAFFTFSVVLLMGALISHKLYADYYNWLQTFPKIKSVSKNWTIQGDRIAIIGRNFGDPWRIGTVWMDDIQYTIVSWNDERIVAEQPVTDQFKKGTLILKNEYSNKVAVTDFEIRNPTEVLE